MDSQERGAAGGGGKSSATITLSLGEWITQVSGTVGPNGLMVSACLSLALLELDYNFHIWLDADSRSWYLAV